MSFKTVGREFFALQFDNLLLDTSIWAILLPPIRVIPFLEIPTSSFYNKSILWLIRWLMFRLMVGSGLCKVTSGDKTWRNGNFSPLAFSLPPLPSCLTTHRECEGLGTEGKADGEKGRGKREEDRIPYTIIYFCPFFPFFPFFLFIPPLPFPPVSLHLEGNFGTRNGKMSFWSILSYLWLFHPPLLLLSFTPSLPHCFSNRYCFDVSLLVSTNGMLFPSYLNTLFYFNIYYLFLFLFVI